MARPEGAQPVLGASGVQLDPQFADHKNLGVGDKLTLTREGQKVTVTIAGILEGKTDNPTGLPSGASENHVFVDLASAQKLGAPLTTGRYCTQNAQTNSCKTQLGNIMANMQLDHVNFSYPNSAKRVLSNVTYDFEESTFYTIIGSSGAALFQCRPCRFGLPLRSQFLRSRSAMLGSKKAEGVYFQ